MNNKQAALARKQLERRLEPLRQMTLLAPPEAGSELFGSPWA